MFGFFLNEKWIFFAVSVISESFWKETLFWDGHPVWFVRGLKEKDALFLQWKYQGGTARYLEHFFVLLRTNGCSGRIRTCDLRVMSPASDQTALHCDKIESTELLHPHKSFTINGGIELPSIQRLSGFLPFLHALRLLTGWFLRCSQNAIFCIATNLISYRIGKMKAVVLIAQNRSDKSLTYRGATSKCRL